MARIKPAKTKVSTIENSSTMIKSNSSSSASSLRISKELFSLFHFKGSESFWMADPRVRLNAYWLYRLEHITAPVNPDRTFWSDSGFLLRWLIFLFQVRHSESLWVIERRLESRLLMLVILNIQFFFDFFDSQIDFLFGDFINWKRMLPQFTGDRPFISIQLAWI